MHPYSCIAQLLVILLIDENLKNYNAFQRNAILLHYTHSVILIFYHILYNELEKTLFRIILIKSAIILI